MATIFPNGLDLFPNPSGSIGLGSNGALKHSTQHQNINDAMTAVQAHIGISGSTNPDSINYKINQLKQDVNSLINVSNSVDLCQIQFLNSNGPFEGFGELQYFRDTIYVGHFVNTIIWYKDYSKSKKIFEIEYSDRNNKKQATRIVYTAYNSDGVGIKSKMEDIITYSGPRELYRTRTVI